MRRNKYKVPGRPDPSELDELEEFDWFSRCDPVPPPPKGIPITTWDVLTMTGSKNEDPYDRRLRFLRQLSNTCMSCTMCELGRRDAEKDGIVRDGHVLSNLNPTRFVVIGQNPGWNELEDREPFVGAAGKNFDTELARNGLSREDFYITNTVKCWTTNNSKPGHKHVERCSPFLRMELNIINPLLVIALGAVAFDVLCPGVSFSDSLKNITQSENYGVPVFAVYHPSPLSLNSGGRMKPFQDQMRILCKLVKGLSK